MNNKSVYLDVETTGLDNKTAGIIQLAIVVEIDGEIEESIKWDLNPGKNIRKRVIQVSQEALDVNKKTTDDIKGFKAGNEVFNEFIEVLTKYIDTDNWEDSFTFVAYNSAFDVGFIKQWFYDNKYPFRDYFNYKDIDIFAIVKYLQWLGIIDTGKSQSLVNVCKYYEIELDAHDALNDINATIELHKLLLERFIKNES